MPMAPRLQITKKSGEFGVSPFHAQLPASKDPDGARRLHGSRNNAYGCFGPNSDGLDENERCPPWPLTNGHHDAALTRAKAARRSAIPKSGDCSNAPQLTINGPLPHMQVTNGLYTIRIKMKDGKRGRATGVIMLFDGHVRVCRSTSCGLNLLSVTNGDAGAIRHASASTLLRVVPSPAAKNGSADFQATIVRRAAADGCVHGRRRSARSPARRRDP